MSVIPKSMTNSLLDRRVKYLDNYSYKLDTSSSRFGMDTPFAADPMDIDEANMAVWIPFASGERRDGVGDLLEVGGIDTSRHVKNPIVLFDHGKTVTLPVGLSEEPNTKEYMVQIDTMNRTARAKAYFYQGNSGALADDPFSDGQKGNYDHALFCEQLFDLIVKRYVRAGSIGYQVVKAMPMPPDYMTGTPQGLHLLQTLLLEVSAVVMPANADTVRKALAMPKVAGKPLSPVLVKSLAPYAAPRKAQMGYEQKAPNKEGADRANARYRAMQRMGASDYQSMRSAVDEAEAGTLNNYSRDSTIHLDPRQIRDRQNGIRQTVRETRDHIRTPGVIHGEVEPAPQYERDDTGNPVDEPLDESQPEQKSVRATRKAFGPQPRIEVLRPAASYEHDFAVDNGFADANGETLADDRYGEAGSRHTETSDPAERRFYFNARKQDSAYIPMDVGPAEQNEYQRNHSRRQFMDATGENTGEPYDENVRAVASAYHQSGDDVDRQVMADALEESGHSNLSELSRASGQMARRVAANAAKQSGKSVRVGRKAQPSDNISAGKARQMLEDGTAHGHPLTEKQQRMLGAAAGRGEKARYLRLTDDALYDIDTEAPEVAADPPTGERLREEGPIPPLRDGHGGTMSNYDTAQWYRQAQSVPMYPEEMRQLYPSPHERPIGKDNAPGLIDERTNKAVKSVRKKYRQDGYDLDEDLKAIKAVQDWYFKAGDDFEHGYADDQPTQNIKRPKSKLGSDFDDIPYQDENYKPVTQRYQQRYAPFTSAQPYRDRPNYEEPSRVLPPDPGSVEAAVPEEELAQQTEDWSRLENQTWSDFDEGEFARLPHAQVARWRNDGTGGINAPASQGSEDLPGGSHYPKDPYGYEKAQPVNMNQALRRTQELDEQAVLNALGDDGEVIDLAGFDPSDTSWDDELPGTDEKRQSVKNIKSVRNKYRGR